MILGIVGQIGSGKGTVADYLSESKGFVHMSFAESVKDALSAIFGWDREMLEGRTSESRKIREKVDKWWAERLGIPHLTPRWMLQHWGTYIGRDTFHEDVWVASLENKLKNFDSDVVISDCRFPNEFEAIKRIGGKIIRVKRGPEPEWYNTAIIATSTHPEATIARKKLQDLGIHSSEWEWYNLTFDFVIENDSSVEELQQKVDTIITSLGTNHLASI